MCGEVWGGLGMCGGPWALWENVQGDPAECCETFEECAGNPAECCETFEEGGDYSLFRPTNQFFQNSLLSFLEIHPHLRTNSACVYASQG
jgi:hypothetical protein